MSDNDIAAKQRELESFGYAQELKREVSTVDLLVYGLVFMVPIAPWAIFGTVYNSSSGMVPLVYLIGLIAMVFTALAYAQMAKSFPLAGSAFSYVGRGVHPGAGFFAGVGDPARLPAGAHAALRVRRGVDDRAVPGYTTVVVGHRLRHRQHPDQPGPGMAR